MNLLTHGARPVGNRMRCGRACAPQRGGASALACCEAMAGARLPGHVPKATQEATGPPTHRHRARGELAPPVLVRVSRHACRREHGERRPDEFPPQTDRCLAPLAPLAQKCAAGGGAPSSHLHPLQNCRPPIGSGSPAGRSAFAASQLLLAMQAQARAAHPAVPPLCCRWSPTYSSCKSAWMHEKKG